MLVICIIIPVFQFIYKPRQTNTFNLNRYQRWTPVLLPRGRVSKPAGRKKTADDSGAAVRIRD